MLYFIVKLLVRIGLRFFIPYFKKQGLEQIDLSKPTIVIANHPNSFFDALILATQTPYTFKFMVRGDIFKNKWANKALRSLNMLPIHKKENNPNAHVDNEDSYLETAQALKAGYKIIIFPEGRSFNDWTLHPLKKGGISKIIEAAHAVGIYPIVQPFTNTYNSFHTAPKAVLLEAYPAITPQINADGSLNANQLMDDIEACFSKNIKTNDAYVVQPSATKRALLFIPMLLGWIVNYPYYKLWAKWVMKKTKGVIFYDSIVFGAMVFTYPLLVLVISILVSYFTENHWYGVITFITLPLSALAMAHYTKIHYTKNGASL